MGLPAPCSLPVSQCLPTFSTPLGGGPRAAGLGSGGPGWEKTPPCALMGAELASPHPLRVLGTGPLPSGWGPARPHGSLCASAGQLCELQHQLEDQPVYAVPRPPGGGVKRGKDWELPGNSPALPPQVPLPACPHLPSTQLCSLSGPPLHAAPSLPLHPHPASLHSHRALPSGPSWSSASLVSGLTTPLSILSQSWLLSLCCLAKGVAVEWGSPSPHRGVGPDSLSTLCPRHLSTVLGQAPCPLCPLGQGCEAVGSGPVGHKGLAGGAALSEG